MFQFLVIGIDTKTNIRVTIYKGTEEDFRTFVKANPNYKEGFREVFFSNYKV